MTRQRNHRAHPTASTATLNSVSTPSTANAHMPNQAETWFLSFALFAYDPTASIRSNFDRLSSQRKWGEKLRRKHWKNCQAASAALNHDDADNNVHSQIPSRAGTWFQKFPPFVHDPTAGIRSNFERLAAQRNWVGKTAKKRWADCQAEEFDYAYGADTTKLEIWQNLCREVHISDPPDSINQCKKVLGSRNVLVNLVNLIDHRNIGVEVIRFENHNKFLEYTCPNNIFPRERAKRDGFISALLRKL